MSRRLYTESSFDLGLLFLLIVVIACFFVLFGGD